eukprot:scpid55523/ scgid29025/ 
MDSESQSAGIHAAALTCISQLETMVSCPVCQYVYGEQRHAVTLRCSHTICYECLETLHKMATEERPLECPLDRKALDKEALTSVRRSIALESIGELFATTIAAMEKARYGSSAAESSDKPTTNMAVQSQTVASSQPESTSASHTAAGDGEKCTRQHVPRMAQDIQASLPVHLAPNSFDEFPPLSSGRCCVSGQDAQPGRTARPALQAGQIDPLTVQNVGGHIDSQSGPTQTAPHYSATAVSVGNRPAATMYRDSERSRAVTEPQQPSLTAVNDQGPRRAGTGIGDVVQMAPPDQPTTTHSRRRQKMHALLHGSSNAAPPLATQQQAYVASHPGQPNILSTSEQLSQTGATALPGCVEASSRPSPSAPPLALEPDCQL